MKIRRKKQVCSMLKYFKLKILKNDMSWKTKPRGPIKICVPKKEIDYVVNLLSIKVKTPIVVHRQWILMAHD